MIVVNLCGGLGNQMFQYAFGRYLSLTLKHELFLNRSNYDTGTSIRVFTLDIFKLGNCLVGNDVDLRKLVDTGKKKVVMLDERFFHYDGVLVEAIHQAFKGYTQSELILVLSGYWQSYRYFSEIKHIIKTDFEFRNPLKEHWEDLCKKIRSENAVMVNVRRSDYLQKLDFHGVVDVHYLSTSIEYCRKNLEKPSFYLFSDDIAWCRNALADESGITIVDEAYYDEKFQFYLNLMSNCNSFILANSTFSWWAAWLSDNEEKTVIAPRKWFVTDQMNTKDLLPSEWLQF